MGAPPILLAVVTVAGLAGCAGVRGPQGTPADFAELGLAGAWDFDMVAPLPRYGELVFGALGRVTARCESDPELTRSAFDTRLDPNGTVSVWACGVQLQIPAPVHGDTVDVRARYFETEEHLERRCVDPDVHPIRCTRSTMVAVPRRVPREATIHITRRVTVERRDPLLTPRASSRSPARRTWRRGR
jgi:hypothetical protein